MNRFIPCVCLGLIVLISPPRANGQGDKEQRFEDVTFEASAAGKMPGKGVVLLEFDKDGDGRLDVYVTGQPNAHVGRGIAVGDFDSDGWLDLFVNNELVPPRGPVTETIKIEGGKVEIRGQSITVEGGKVEIIRRRP
jgi:hypothetical protein